MHTALKVLYPYGVYNVSKLQIIHFVLSLPAIRANIPGNILAAMSKKENPTTYPMRILWRIALSHGTVAL